MIEEKINYYISRINNLKKDLEFENEKIFEYENLLINEKKDYNQLSFLGKFFSKNNHINLIEKLLEEHNQKSIKKEKEIKTTIDELIFTGSKNTEFDKLEEDNKLIIKNIEEEKLYLKTIYDTLSSLLNLFNENHSKLNKLSISVGYDGIDEYKRIFNSFLKILSKIKSLKLLISSYKIFDNYIEKIDFSMSEILKSFSILGEIDKVKDLKGKGASFEPVKINLDILLNLFHNIYNEIERNLLDLENKKDNLIKNNEILFINELLSKHNFDITNH